MTFFRFKVEFNNAPKNGIWVFSTVKDGNTFPLLEKDILAVPLQFSLIEAGSFVYQEDIKDATWTAELFPEFEIVETTWFSGSFDEGEFIEHSSEQWLCSVTRVSDGSSHKLHVTYDTRNVLVAHLMSEDSVQFPFDEHEKVVICMQVTDVKKDAYCPTDDDLSNNEFETFPVWSAKLVPIGQRVNDVIISKVYRLSEWDSRMMNKAETEQSRVKVKQLLLPGLSQ